MKIGTRVQIKDTGDYGKVIDIRSATMDVLLDTGEIITIIQDAVTIVSLLKKLWIGIRSIFSF